MANAVFYGVRRDTGRIDYDQVRSLALKHEPKLIVAGGASYPRAIDFALLRGVADEVGARLLVDIAHFAGLVAAGVHPHRFLTPTSSPRRRTNRSGERVAGSFSGTTRD